MEFDLSSVFEGVYELQEVHVDTILDGVVGSVVLLKPLNSDSQLYLYGASLKKILACSPGCMFDVASESSRYKEWGSSMWRSEFDSEKISRLEFSCDIKAYDRDFSYDRFSKKWKGPISVDLSIRIINSFIMAFEAHIFSNALSQEPERIKEKAFEEFMINVLSTVNDLLVHERWLWRRRTPILKNS